MVVLVFLRFFLGRVERSVVLLFEGLSAVR